MNQRDRGEWPALDDQAGPAVPISQEQQDLLVAGVLREAKPAPRMRRPGSGRMAALLMAAVVVTAGGAAAGDALVDLWSQQRLEEGRATARASAAIARGAAAHAAEWQAPPSAPVKPASVEAAPVEDEMSPEEPAHEQKVSPAQVQQQAIDELAEANRLRAAQQWPEARAAYRNVRQKYSRSFQAQVATLAEAELLLLHLGQPAAAKSLFESMTQAGSLGPEAWFGLARAEAAVGNSTGQSEALRQLVQRFPESPLVPAARRQLQRSAGDDAATGQAEQK